MRHILLKSGKYFNKKELSTSETVTVTQRKLKICLNLS